jgi:chaperonin GroEL
MGDEFTPKSFRFSKEARDKLLSGARIVHDAVGATMGPSGQLVAFNMPTSLYPALTKDGVSVASMIALKDEQENIGAMMLIQAARKQVIEAGDGTTLTVILSYKIFSKGVDALGKGTDFVEITRGIREATKRLETIIRNHARTSTPADIVHIATIATNNDVQLGHIIADAVNKTGIHGIVAYAKSDTDQHKCEFVDGYQWNSGIEYKEFTNSPNGLFLENPLILVTDQVISYADELVPIIARIQEYYPGKKPDKFPPLVIIGREVRGDAMTAIIGNLTKELCFIYHIRPGGGLMTKEQEYCLRDICALTGAAYISEKSGIRIKDVSYAQLGTCAQLVSGREKTVLRAVINKSKAVEERIKFLKDTKANITDELEKKYCDTSIAKLLGGMATIMVGGKTSSEQQEVMDRVDDAIKSCRAAQEEGIVRGGGVAMLTAFREFVPENKGEQILADVLLYPAEKILGNAHIKDSKKIIENIIDGKCNGYNIETGKVAKDMFDMGIVDPAKVVVNALKNAASVAALMLQTDVIITDLKGK